MALQTRIINKSELSALIDLYTHLHETDDPLPDDASLTQVWDEILTDPKIDCFVVECENKLVASCIMAVIPNLTRGARPYGLIENVVTHPDYRKRGIGTALLRHALQKAWDKNCYKVMLLTGSKQDETLLFYEKAGFLKDRKTGFIAYP